MKKIKIWIFFLIIISCKIETEHYEEYYHGGKLKAIGKTKNGLFEGQVIRYFENGNILSIRNYKNGKLDGYEKAYSDVNPSIELIAFYKDGKIIKEKLYDTITGNIMSTFDNHIARIYYKENQPVKIICRQDTANLKFIKFTNDNKLRAYQGPLDFLTKKDSSDLTNAYPNWKEMIKEWEHNQLKDKHEK